MSRGDENSRAALLERMARALREQSGLGASFFRAAAARASMPVTDLQVLDALDSGGLTTAGQLAEQAGLTTGAITGMLNRLEEAGLVRRERDPNDGRKVIVRLAPGKEHMGEIHAIFAAADVSAELAGGYDDDQLALIVAFLERGNALTRQSIAALREAPVEEPGAFTAALGAVTRGRLVVSHGMSRLTLGAADDMAELYRAHFSGVVPDVKVKDGNVTIRYPRRLMMLGGKDRQAEVTLNAAVPWQIEVNGSGAEINADLRGLTLSGLEAKGNASLITFALPHPAGMVPLRISGSASEIRLRRPAGVPVRAHLQGWVSTFELDGQRFSDVGNDLRLQSGDDAADEYGYDIEVISSASTVRITAE
ncbi:MAG TPA: MarR family transcriptional regulator [Ktedonobacterales bacterium]|nr:MarR family transcriptional regulator [Ktedonobacterales bacterium]